MFDIDYIYIKNSQLLDILDVYVSKNNSLTIKKYQNSLFETKNIQNESTNTNEIQLQNIILIEEIDSFLETEEIYENVLKFAPKNAIKIILTANHNFYNVVQWIRKGATDVLLTSSLSERNLFRSILSAQNYLRDVNKVQNETKIEKTDTDLKQKYKNERILIPKNCNWGNIKQNEQIDMTLVMVSFSFDNTHKVLTATEITNLYDAAKIQINRLVSYFGGTMWFWSINCGAMVFHFDDHVNAAVTACIHMINRLAITYIEKIKIKNIPLFRLSIHTGNEVFQTTHTEDLHCDLINFSSHLLTKYVPSNSLCITEEIYKKLSVRLVDYFSEFGTFENQKIYKY